MARRAIGAFERRIWRLAFLLTGDGAIAADVIDSVLRDQPDPGSLEPARLDRLVVLHTREARSRGVPGSDVLSDPRAARALSAVVNLEHQPREAWVLARLDELDELRVSRAMDCSKTAAGRHLEAADEAMARALGAELAECVDALRRAADALDPSPIIVLRRSLRRRERNRRALIVAGVTVTVIAGAGLVVLRLLR